MDLKLPYGIKNNELLSIEEVESGLACNCTCPACEKQLIARKGEIKIHHFAHYNSDDCGGGLETALHILCKELIAKSNAFITPRLYYRETNYEIFEEANILVDKVYLESRIGEIIPDVIIESKGRRLLIEIIVSNPVNENKLRRIKFENLPTIVIYARYALEYAFSKNDFRIQDNFLQNELLNGTKYKRWLYNPRIKLIEKSLYEDYAEVKQVKSFKIEERDFEYVENCPFEKKTWQSGKNRGKPYASAEYDCPRCDFCYFIENKYIQDKRLIFHQYSISDKVYCLGHLKKDFGSLLKQLR